MNDWGILGHDWAVDLLKGQLARGGPRHAYLFTGPQGIGRRTLAVALAKALNCTQPPAPAGFCGQCRACQLLDRMQHPDLSVVQRQEGDRDLKIEAVRDLQHSLSLAPYEASYRVALLLRFEDANPSAANALLKTLEEPPPRVVLVLTAESGEALLPTIVSRCEVLRLRPVPVAEVSEGLVSQWGIPPDRADFLAHISGGRPGYALGLHREPEQLEQRQAWLDDQQHLLSADRVARFNYAETLAKDKDNLVAALQVWLSYWRDVLLRSAEAGAVLTNLDREAEIERLSAHLELDAARQVVSSLEHTQSLLRTNVNPRLALEVLLLGMPKI